MNDPLDSRRPQRRPYDSGGQEWFPVRSKGSIANPYPASGVAAGWVLPCVYTQARFALGDTTLTSRDSTREDLVWSNAWHPEGTYFEAVRIGERLYGIPLPDGWYSVRSYIPAGQPNAGQTNWIADYWYGSDGTFTPSHTGPPLVSPSGPLGGDRLRVAVDAAGDVYVAGPRAVAGGVYWNLVKFSKSNGAVIWKADISTGGDTGNLWSILISPYDSKIYVMGDSANATGNSTVNVIKVEPSTGAALGTAFTASGLSLKLADFSYASVVASLPLSLPFGGTNGHPRYQTIVGSKLLSLANSTDPSDNQSQLSVSGLPLAIVAPYRSYLIQDFTAWPFVSVAAADMITGGSGLLVAASASTLYFNNPSDTGKLALFDTGIDTAIYPMTYRWKLTDAKTLLKFQDASYLVAIGATPTSTLLMNVSDGSKVFAHNHLQVTDIAPTSDALVMVGARRHPASDVSFV